MVVKVKQRKARKVYTPEFAESFANAVNVSVRQVRREESHVSPSGAKLRCLANRELL
ncbi:hypothetical protein [Vibrio atypicus]|uniref:hypothetical protein n=1 Tax=Vibrio atypicus TaxID=558271 RepID=UPI00135BD657|nr:hypothetical protein [Vibrio atypicus]